MHRLWAPWRMEYIENVDKTEGCFLCEAIEENDDKKNLILYRGKDVFVIMNRYPYNSGHVMVVPYAHVSDLNDLSDSCRNELLEVGGKTMKIMEDAINCQGVNMGMNFGRPAGAGLEDHLHLHIVPRWVGDVNFFPVFSDTKSMPEYLEETYNRLVPGFSNK